MRTAITNVWVNRGLQYHYQNMISYSKNPGWSKSQRCDSKSYSRIQDDQSQRNDSIKSVRGRAGEGRLDEVTVEAFLVRGPWMWSCVSVELCNSPPLTVGEVTPSLPFFLSHARVGSCCSWAGERESRPYLNLSSSHSNFITVTSGCIYHAVSRL